MLLCRMFDQEARMLGALHRGQDEILELEPKCKRRTWKVVCQRGDLWILLNYNHPIVVVVKRQESE